MVSAKQIAANRGNAQSSTGPRTPAGKARSSQNAVTHGLLAQRVLLDDEDPAVYEALEAGVFAQFQPAGPVEAQLAHRIASTLWRLRRVERIEAGLLEAAREDRLESDELLETMRQMHRPAGSSGNGGGGDAAAASQPGVSAATRRLGRAFAQSGRALLTLQRHERSLQHALRDDRRMLAELQEQRQGWPSEADGPIEAVAETLD